MKTRFWMALLAAIVSFQAAGKEPPKFDTDKAKFSYAIGYQIAEGLKHDNLDVDADVVAAAIADILSGKPPRVSMEDMQGAVVAYQEKRMADYRALAEKNRTAGEAFLADNKGKEGVVTLESGLQYRVVAAGQGPHPGAEDTVVVNYRGTLLDGTEFDSSFKRGEPATFPVNAVIQGWQEVLPLMQKGATWKVFVPSDLAYGQRGSGAAIGPNATLIFDIELLDIK